MANQPMTLQPPPPMLTAAFWRATQCPWCGSSGMFVHMPAPSTLVCDACDVWWDPTFLGTVIAEMLLMSWTTPTRPFRRLALYRLDAQQ